MFLGVSNGASVGVEVGVSIKKMVSKHNEAAKPEACLGTQSTEQHY